MISLEVSDPIGYAVVRTRSWPGAGPRGFLQPSDNVELKNFRPRAFQGLWCTRGTAIAITRGEHNETHSHGDRDMTRLSSFARIAAAAVVLQSVAFTALHTAITFAA